MPWKFSKPVTPGFGLSKRYYLTVLSTRPVLPTILQLISPKGEQGAVEGFGVPMMPDAGKESVGQPMVRGKYALASKDRKSVLSMMVLDPGEAGFSAEVFARSPMAQHFGEEVLARVRGTWQICQLSFESHDAAVYPALDFLQALTIRLATLTDGVVADPIAQRYLLPNQVRKSDRLDPKVDAREHVAVVASGANLFTLGMQKFVLPELELNDIEARSRELAESLLIIACQQALLGNVIKNGDKLGAKRAGFEARPAVDRGRWNGIAALELLPPTGIAVSDALQAWLGEATGP